MKLQKRALLAKFEEAVRLGGWNLLYLSKGDHPARYRISRNGMDVTVRVFIWNITHGGKKRSADEYRIQVTGVDKLVPESGARNLILGWWDEAGVFAGWDIRQHQGTTSSSPSMQISEGALRQAFLTGFAPYRNKNGETAIALRPDFMATYIEFLESLHDSGTVPKESAILMRISDDPAKVSDAEIEGDIATTRRYAVISTKKAIRALDFARRVLTAYDHKCAMCGVQLRLVDGAHILPVAHKDSTDQTSNGVALCALHHRAYDRGLVGFDSLYKIHVNEKMIRDLEAEDRLAGLPAFRKALRALLIVPADKRDRPAKKFVEFGNTLRGWK